MLDYLGAFDVERLQFLGGEGDELAATVFVPFDDLAFVDLLAGPGIMRPKRDPSGGPALVHFEVGIVGGELRCRLCRTLLPGTPIGQLVLVHIDRCWLPYLVQTDGFRARRRGRQIDRAGHERKSQKTSPTCPRHSKFSLLIQ